MLYLFFLKKLKTKALKVFFIYICYIVVHTALTILLKYLKTYPAYTILLRFFNIIEFGFLSIFFLNLIKSELAKKLILLVQPLFILFCVVDYFTTKQPSIGYFPAAAECLLMLSIIVFFFFELMKNVVSEPIYLVIEFWLGVALLLYFSGNFFLFLYSRTMIDDKDFAVTYKIIYSTIIIIKNIFLFIAIRFSLNLTSIKRNIDSSSIDFGNNTFLT